ncbi:MAG: endonuclease/exonuclease/phosphatase [Sphingobacteriales bacterium]|nr:MAG: endonuclease/exonuclease/phosphatase [Sphingobacteriales bacterium]
MKKNLCAIAFYNAENFFDPADDPEKEDDDFTPTGANKYTKEVYKQKLQNISIVITRMGKDLVPEGAALIGLAEVENAKVLADLTAQPLIAAKGYKYILYNAYDPRGIDVALLYDPKVFHVIKSMPVAIRIPQKATRDILYVHGVLYKDTVHVLVNHWPSRRDGEQESRDDRRIAAETNRKFIDDLRRKQPNAKIILMGDLNDDPIDISVATVLKGNGSMPSLLASELYNPWLALHKPATTGTLQYKRKWNLFDQILVSKPLTDSRRGLRYHSAVIFNKEFLQQTSGRYKGSPYRSYRGTYWMNGYSDHYPVVMYLSWN